MSFNMETGDFGNNDRAKELDRSDIDGTTFFDENEDRHSGSQIDEATGKKYNNSDDMDASSPEKQAIHETDFSDNGLVKEDDLATALLLEQYKDQPEILREMGIDPRKAA